MVSSLLFIFIAITVSAFVALPLIQARHSGARGASSNHRANDLVERKEEIYEAMKEIEFDFQMGKLSEDDYKELRQQYKEQAIGLLQQIDKIKKGDVVETKAGKKADANYCWTCGTPIVEADNFCPNCGTKLK